MKTPALFVVTGKRLNKDFDNLHALDSLVIPNIGDTIVFRNVHNKVVDKIISYSQVENYDIEDTDRGSELIYIFVEPV
jgi:hypothetical protein